MKPSNTATPFLFLVLALTAIVMLWQPIAEHQYDSKLDMPCATFDVANTLPRRIDVMVNEAAFPVSGFTNGHF